MPRTHRSLPRLHLDTPMSQGAVLSLAREQVNYLVNVLRRTEGDQLVVFNGRDGAWLAELATASRKAATLVLVEQSAPQSPAPDLWYGFAPLKSARLDYVVQKATEMGVGIIQPVITQHTQVHRLKLEKLKANTVEAAEQCEVLAIPEVRHEQHLDRLIADWETSEPDRLLFFADEGASSASPVEVIRAEDGNRVGLIVGPEGGFSDEERELLLAQSFTRPISLGPRILRADTAAVAALAAIQSTIGDWR